MSSINSTDIKEASDLGIDPRAQHSDRSSVEIVQLLDGSKYSELNTKITAYNAAVIDYQQAPSPKNTEKLGNLAKALAEDVSSEEGLTAAVINGTLNQVKFALVDLIFHSSIEYANETVDLKSKHTLAEYVVELTFVQATLDLQKQWDLKRAEDLKDVQRLLSGLNVNNPSILIYEPGFEEDGTPRPLNNVSG